MHCLIGDSKTPPRQSESTTNHFPMECSSISDGEQEKKLPLLPLLRHGARPPECTGDGSVDFRGNPALKHHTGNWRACYSILGGGAFCASVAYLGVATNLVTYLTNARNQSNVTAASNAVAWQRTCFLTPLLGAFLADSYWGKHRTIVISLVVCAIGMSLLTLSATVVSSDLPADAASLQGIVSSLGLYMTAMSCGGIWPCVLPFGADQFDDTDRAEKAQKESYYNWYFFSINIGLLLTSTVLVWIQDYCGWALGFGIPALFSVIGLGSFLACLKLYRYHKPGGSAFTRICQVVVAATSKWDSDVPYDRSLLYEMLGKESEIVGSRKLEHTPGLRFFDRAAIVTAYDATSAGQRNPWRLCTVTQVEELKILARMLPILLTIVIFSSSEASTSLFIEQGAVMDNHIGPFDVPPASLMAITSICSLTLVPVYDKILAPMAKRLTGKKHGLSELQRLGISMFFSILSLLSAALVEAVRINIAKYNHLVYRKAAVPMGILWQSPQYLLLGVGKVFGTVGVLEFACEESPDAMRSLCQAFALAMVTLGSYLVSGVLAVIAAVTGGGGRPGWIPENLNEGHLDRYFWLMAGIGVLNLLAFVCCATTYKRKMAS